MDTSTIIIFVAALVFVSAAVGLLKAFAKTASDTLKQEAAVEFEANVPATIQFIQAYGKTALGFSETGGVWVWQKPSPVWQLNRGDVSSWYAGEVVFTGLDAGTASTTNLMLEQSGSEDRMAAREARPSYVLIYGGGERLLVKVGIVDKADTEEVRVWLEKAFPGKECKEPGSLTLQPAGSFAA
ncbi:hypothetical protein [Hyphomonas pacifica]|uniref:Uncharacterized protein n=1 Tax=Hyphomonas pacifica TaxID=1280941 RepID=A0A062U1A1_9PROT|nr:hypothetical protein [Hyphomonas pacifica]KCZ52057.1 hypothetical protein HY2_10150 [Hyphomonas pacifica]RAN34659.1 hypothetical protein HY3_10140 [Hyphomonas pacifica]